MRTYFSISDHISAFYDEPATYFLQFLRSKEMKNGIKVCVRLQFRPGSEKRSRVASRLGPILIPNRRTQGLAGWRQKNRRKQSAVADHRRLEIVEKLPTSLGT